MDCSFGATQVWQPVMTGLMLAIGILVAGTVLLYGAVLGLGALIDRRETRQRLTRLRGVVSDAEHDHHQVVARSAQVASAPRLLDRLGHADDAHCAVTALMGDDPDLTHRSAEIDEAVAHYRHAVDRLTTTWPTGAAALPTAGPTASADVTPVRTPELSR